MTTSEADRPSAAERDCYAPGIVCIDAGDEHLHVHAATWERMKEVAEMLEGERDERSELGT